MIVSGEISQSRVSKWLAQATSIENTTWTETRQVIEFGAHVYPLVNGQVFQCGHCGHYDPQWSATEVIKFFQETFGIKPTEIQVTCTVAKS